MSDELSQYIDDQIDQSRSYYSDIREEQDLNNKYYFMIQDGDLAIPEVDGRSGFVSSDVSDLIEWMMPSLMEMFTASNDVIQLEPQGMEDVDFSQEWTDYLNYLFYRKNNGFVILYQMFKTALLEKLGAVRVDWKINNDVITRRFRGISPDQLAMIEPDSLIAANQRDDGLYDVEVKEVRSSGTVLVQNVPNGELFLSADAKIGEKPSFAAQVTRKTLTELRNEGWEVSDDAADAAIDFMDQELHYGSPKWEYDNIGTDPAMREVRFVDAYCYYDLNEDGIAEYCRVVKAGDEVLLVEETDDHPFSFAIPIIVPNELYGVAPADQARDFEKLNTDVMRAFIDNMRMQVNGRMGVIEGEVNLDDVLTVRPAGVVRMSRPDALFPISQPNVLNDAISAVSVFDQQKENRTGWTKYSQGTDSNSLNKTATGINIITNRGDMRLKLIARSLAETGVSDMFKKMMKVAIANATGAERYRLNGKVTDFDPVSAGDSYDFILNVGLGAGNKDQKIAHLTNLIQLQNAGKEYGVVKPENVYNALQAIAEETGYKGENKFFTNPQQDQGSPEAAQLQQAEEAIEQLRGMLEQSQQESEARIQALEQQLQNASETEKTRQAIIEKEIQAEKTRQKELDLLILRAQSNPMMMDETWPT